MGDLNDPRYRFSRDGFKEYWNQQGGKEDFKNLFGDFVKNGNEFFSNNNLGVSTGNFLSAFGNGLSSALDIGSKGDSLTESQQASQSTIRSALNLIPYGALANVILGASDFAGSLGGWNTSNIEDNSAKMAGIKTSWINRAINYVPGLSSIVGWISRLTGNKRTNDFDLDSGAVSMMSGNYGAVQQLLSTNDLADKQLLWGQTKKVNDFIDNSKIIQDYLSNEYRTNVMRNSSRFHETLEDNYLNKMSGRSPLNIAFAKNGLKIISAEESRRILLQLNKQEPEKLQNGGNIPGIDTNVLPEGSLHKELNHLDDINPELGDDITKKGIPVITIDENGDINQIAEVEESEIIFKIDITKKLEELMADGSDEAMIEAGKLVAEEIITNVSDPNNIIDSENGEN